MFQASDRMDSNMIVSIACLRSYIPSRSSSSNPLPIVFFYGTLCVPAVLAKVLGHKCKNITFQDALLPVSFEDNRRRVTNARDL